MTTATTVAMRVVVAVLVAAVVLCLARRRGGRGGRGGRVRLRSSSRVVVVGNGAFVGLGSQIDAFDVVVRVNPLDPRPARNVGRRTDIMHLNENLSDHRIRHVPTGCEVWTRILAASRRQLGERRRIVQHPMRALRLKYPEWRDRCSSINRYGRLPQMTSGTLTILHLLEHVPRVWTAGINAYRSATHAGRQSSHAFHQQNLERFHCIDVEAALLDRLRREGRVLPLD